MGRKYESNERLFLGKNKRGYVLQLFFVDDEYAGTVKLTNLDNGESNISFPSCDDGLIINPADKHIK